MKKVVPVIIAIALVLTFTGMTFSAGNEKTKVFGGRVKAIDVKEKTMTLSNDNVPEFICSVDDKNISKKTSGNKTLADIKAGDIAVVVYGEVNGKNVAKSITVTTPAASSSGEKTKPASSEGKK